MIDPIDRIAEQLSTVCASLGEYPSVRIFKPPNASDPHFEKVERLANLVVTKMNSYKADDPNLVKVL